MSDGSQRPSPLIVSVVDGQGRTFRAPGLGRWLARVAPARARGEVTVAVVPDARVRALNRTYRGKDTATDVLSFQYGLQTSDSRLQTPGSRLQTPGSRLQTPGSRLRTRRPQSAVRSPQPVVHSRQSGVFLGDIVIARGVARRQAASHAHAESTEWRVLALHGLLHLLGYDHEADGGAMRRVEQRLRRKGGLTRGLIERTPASPPFRRPRGTTR